MRRWRSSGRPGSGPGDPRRWRALEAGAARSVRRERSCDDLACRLVRADHDPGGGDRAVDELQRGGDGAVREQALARPDDEGEDPQTLLVDEAVAHERLDQVPAAMHLEPWPILLLERGDPFGRVS